MSIRAIQLDSWQKELFLVELHKKPDRRPAALNLSVVKYDSWHENNRVGGLCEGREFVVHGMREVRHSFGVSIDPFQRCLLGILRSIPEWGPLRPLPTSSSESDRKFPPSNRSSKPFRGHLIVGNLQGLACPIEFVNDTFRGMKCSFGFVNDK